MDGITFQPIGVIRSPLREPIGVPVQASIATDVEGTVQVLPEYGPGLEGLGGFSHIILLYHFHLSGSHPLKVRPYLHDRVQGVFATRAPSRPNAIGMSVVRLLGIEDTILHVSDLDVVDGSPLLDIKPFVPEFDHRDGTRVGWLSERLERLEATRDDGRFVVNGEG